MIEKFDYYLKENLVKRESADIGEAMSLFKRARDRLKYIQEQKINEFNSPFIFENIYECMREAVQSLMSLRGYKPYSHEVLIAFLKEFYKIKSSDINNFNRFRMLRNKIVYRAQVVSVEACKEAFDFLVYFLPLLEKELNKEIK
ncbi:MAG TPA: hypothetical protein VJH90_01780 [archaeon]|nr:hypothetical protein [archaeon]